MIILPHSGIESPNEEYNLYQTFKWQKLIKELCLSFYAFCLLITIILSIRSLLVPSSSPYAFTNRLLTDINETVRETNQSNVNASTSSEYELKRLFFSQVNHLIYSGNWVLNATDILTNNSHGDNNNGLIYMQITTNRNNRPNALTIIFRAMEGNSARKWNEITIKADFNSITLMNTSSSLIIKGDVDSTIETNRLSALVNKTMNCRMGFQLEFSSNSTIDTIKEFTKTKGDIKSQCNIELISFDVNIEEPLSDYNIITFYSVLLSLLCVITLTNAVWLNVKLSDSESYANSISLITIYQSIIWNSYGCLSHFYFTLNSIRYFIHFLFPTVLYFINFAISDLNLLYSLWRLKYSRIISNQSLMKRKLIELYCMFYILLFISLFFVNKFYFSKGYIILEVIITWLPQIIYNALYKNNFSLPGISVLTISVSRLFFPCYCRGYSRNFFLIETDYVFVSLCLGVMIGIIALMYSQFAFGSRWFLPKSLADDSWEYYRTFEELIKEKSDADKIECVICLNPLVDSSDNTNSNSNDNINANSIDNNTNSNSKARFLTNDFINESKDEFIYQTNKNVNRTITIMRRLKALLFNFSKTNSNLKHKPFMLTQCNHAFHSVCLESWFIRKKECPNCRKELRLG